MRQVVTTTVPACVDAAHGLLDEVWAAAPDVPTTDRTRFTLAVAEIVGNVARHGRTTDGTAVEVTVSVSVDAQELRADISDDGLAVAGIDESRIGDVLAESGRGIALARASVDELAYERDGLTNRWRVILLRSPAR